MNLGLAACIAVVKVVAGNEQERGRARSEALATERIDNHDWPVMLHRNGLFSLL